MVYVNVFEKCIELKIVYYGTGLAGKTSNLTSLHNSLQAKNKGEMVKLATDSESTIFFDFFPLELGEVQGMAVRLRMYTVPGQDYYEASRRLVLDRADGVVFVIDSAPALLDKNIEAFEDLRRNLERCNLSLEKVPVVFQYNKRDLDDLIPLGTIEEKVGFKPHSVHEAVAAQDVGVKPTAQAISRLVVQQFRF